MADLFRFYVPINFINFEQLCSLTIHIKFSGIKE